MIEKYDAFISYKHAPLDNRIADAIQKGLERYVLPKKVQETTGKHKIERIFRDKSELPITSNLDDNISYALENADFLIVICSKSTKLSGWVPREIECFLQFHPFSHVLTVLAEGEPDEVIPEILLKRKVLLTDAEGAPIPDDQGEPQYVEKMMEPLSCDYRLPPARAKREELPRLAAAIAGCSYDELIMRARQYRMQRLAIFGSAAAVVMTIATAYLLWSRAEIRKNYNISQENLRQAQINQSIYLSHAAESLFENDHDGIGSAQLASAALGDPGEERPLVPQAIRALSQSIHAYVPEGMSTGRFPDGKYEAGSSLLDFAVQKESGKIFLLDESGTASVFDLSGQDLVFSQKFEDAYIERMFLIPAANEKMIICDGFSVFLFDWKEGTEVWKKDLWQSESGETADPEPAGAYMRYMANTAGLVSTDTLLPVAASLSPDGTMLAVDGMNDRIEILDIATGKTIKTLCADILTAVPEAPADDLTSSEAAAGSALADSVSDVLASAEPVSAWQKILWSEDQNYIAAAYLDDRSGSKEIVLAAFESKNGKPHLFRTGAPRFEDYCFADSDSICVISGNEIWEGSCLMAVPGLEGLGANMLPSSSRAACYSISNDIKLWETDLSWHAPWMNRGQIRAIDYQSGTMSEPVRTIGCAVSNMAWLLDARDGTILSSNEFTDSVISIMDYSEMMMLLRNGDGAYLRYNGTQGSGAAHTQMPHFVATSAPYTLDKVVYMKNDEGPAYYCLSENGTAVIRFRSVYDRDGAACGLEGVSASPAGKWKCGRYEILRSDAGEMELYCYDTASKNLLWTLRQEGYQFQRGFTAEIDEAQLFCACGYGDDGESCCFLINPADGAYETIPLSGEFTGAAGDCLYRLKEDTTSVVTFSLRERTETEIPLKEREAVPGSAAEAASGNAAEAIPGNAAEAADGLALGSKIIVSPDGTRAAAASSDNLALLMIDLQKAEVYPIQESIRTKNYFAWSKDSSRYVLGTNTVVYVFDAEGDKVCEIPTEGRFPTGIFLEGDDLYVLYDTGNLFRYSPTAAGGLQAAAEGGGLQGEADSGGLQGAAEDNGLKAAAEEGAAKIGAAADSSLDYELQSDSDNLYLRASGANGWLAIIDRQTMELKNLIESAIDYFPETDVILTGTWNRNKKEYVVTTFEHYSADRLREKAAEFIGGNEIRPEMREQYGLQ